MFGDFRAVKQFPRLLFDFSDEFLRCSKRPKKTAKMQLVRHPGGRQFIAFAQKFIA
jgi:hypothetical protein